MCVSQETIVMCSFSFTPLDLPSASWHWKRVNEIFLFFKHWTGTWLAKRTLHKPQSYCSSFSISLQSLCIKFLCAWALTASQDKQFTTLSQQPVHSYIYIAFRLIRSVIIFLFVISHITFMWHLKVVSSSWVIVNQSKGWFFNSVNTSSQHILIIFLLQILH